MDRQAPRRVSGALNERRIAQRTQVESLILLAMNLRTGIVAGIVGALGALVWLWPHLPASLLLGWAGATLAGMLASIYLVRASRHWAHDEASMARLEGCFAANTFYIGTVWGVLPLLDTHAFGGPAQVIVLMLLGVVALGGTGVLAPSRAVFLAFIVPTLAPILAVLALEPPAAMPHAAIAAGVFAAMLGVLHELFHHMLRSTLAQRLTSDTLAEEQRVILESTTEAIMLTRRDRLLKCNRRFADLVGEPVETVLGRPLWQWLADPNDWHRNAQRARAAMTEGLTFRTKVQLRRTNGELLWVEFNADAVDPARLERGVVWIGQELTSRLRSEATLHASEERYRRLITLTSDWYWEWDARLRFTHLSGPGLARAGLSPALYGHTLGAMSQIGGVSTESWAALQRQIERREPFRDFIWQLQQNGDDARWFSMSGNPTFDTEGRFAGYHGIGSEVTEQMKGSERFRQLAYHDTLTGLPNRRLLDDRLHLAIAQAARRELRLAVMVVDLDNFKIINDSAGHAVGDLVLVSVARRLQGAIRASDTVARLGGDEFVVILPDVEAESANLVAEKITTSLAAPVEAGERQYLLGGSVGLAIYPDDGTSARALLARADAAMYEAKRQGGGRHMAHGTLPHDPAPSRQPSTRTDALS
ncbi:diguanylate cyclase [Nitrogeniibacter mangrovi]|uniref:Diguanylate cyclase n=1 Tax=Nitrogeniibacter mangrovi TaxID=2016596 RepID=A0A6C1B7E6_9RHOO|nr:diguanylate cyclase [Nitrogeniibacter mangrovi]QID18879.1 diguanylate cyclase [Nitrogeniibacter mangrovi]